MRQPGVHLDGDPAVDVIGPLVDVPEQVAAVADVGRGHLADGRVHRGAPRGQLADLVVVGSPVRQRRREDGRVARHADDLLVPDQLGQVARVEPLPGDVVQPDGHARVGECGERVVLRHLDPSRRDRLRRAASVTASAVNPYSRNRVL